MSVSVHCLIRDNFFVSALSNVQDWFSTNELRFVFSFIESVGVFIVLHTVASWNLDQSYFVPDTKNLRDIYTVPTRLLVNQIGVQCLKGYLGNRKDFYSLVSCKIINQLFRWAPNSIFLHLLLF